MPRHTLWIVALLWLAGLGIVAWLTPPRPRFILHDAVVLAFSPDGRVLAVRPPEQRGATEPHGRLIDARTGQPVGTFVVRPFADRPWWIAPGSPLAHAGWERDAGGAWSLPHGLDAGGYAGPPPATAILAPPPRSTAFQPTADRDRLARSDAGDREAVVWHGDRGRSALAVHATATGAVLWTTPLSKPLPADGDPRSDAWRVWACEFSPDGRWLAATAWPAGPQTGDAAPVNDGLTLYDAATGRATVRLPEAGGVAFAADSATAYAVRRVSEGSALVRIDPAAGKSHVIAEYAGRRG